MAIAKRKVLTTRAYASKLWCDLVPGDRIHAHIERDGSFEPESLKAWEAALRPATAAIDVGAYTGLYAILAAKAGCVAWAIEPMTDQQKRIEQNANLNRVSLNVGRWAASDFVGEAPIAFNPNVYLTSGASLVDNNASNTRLEKVKVHTLDQRFENAHDICAIKIDVERNEVKVLRGAKHIIERHRPTLIIETLSGKMLDDVKGELGDAYEYKGRLDDRNSWFAWR